MLVPTIDTSIFDNNKESNESPACKMYNDLSLVQKGCIKSISRVAEKRQSLTKQKVKNPS